MGGEEQKGKDCFCNETDSLSWCILPAAEVRIITLEEEKEPLKSKTGKRRGESFGRSMSDPAPGKEECSGGIRRLWRGIMPGFRLSLALPTMHCTAQWFVMREIDH